MEQENVLVVTLDDQATPEQVLDLLTEPAEDGSFEVRSVAVVRRDPEGKVTIGDHAGELDTEGTIVERHPRLATLFTALLAPLDTLFLGNTLVALTGAVAEPTPDEQVLVQVAKAVPAGGTAVIADVVEQDPAGMDGRIGGLGLTAIRRPLAEVQAELGTVGEQG